jgi:hypothetical protein
MTTASDKKILEYISNLPSELKSIILYFIPLNSVRTYEAKLIGNIKDVYSIDHNHDLTKRVRIHLIHNIMSFQDYVFYSLYENDYDRCRFGRIEYDTLELNPIIEYEVSISN